ncbi:hypothetical protein CSKR_114352 [Clonorchis sinensis]|uniref:Uncharacterized protein n=1 Tax=Clonorchis sinensis TaxID=79923 RepID=A0A3R7D924_CLOSI|nr:hypothetical protein CSKR_114352 [Clonorchis sinensis]
MALRVHLSLSLPITGIPDESPRAPDREDPRWLLNCQKLRTDLRCIDSAEVDYFCYNDFR